MKNKNGITLIALVITIIVLLILAGVAIATLTGENGILKRAVVAKENTEKSAFEEQLNLAVFAVQNGNKDFNKDKLISELGKIEDIEIVEDEDFPIVVSLNGITGQIEEDGTVSLVEKENVDITQEKLLAYFDFEDYRNGSQTWKNRVKTSNDIEIIGNATIDEEGITINRKGKNTYGQLDISNRSNNNLTIYMVVKANEINSDNARIFEIPKNPGGDQGYTTPSMYVNSQSKCINYGSFYTNEVTSANALEFNMVAMTINGETEKINMYIDNQKYADIEFRDMGDILYLSECTYGASGYGNNTYKMIAIYDGLNSEEQIYNDLKLLKSHYIKPFEIDTRGLDEQLETYFDYRNYNSKDKVWKNSNTNNVQTITFERRTFIR